VITFDPLRADDLPLLKEWLGREHVRRWWRDYGQSLGHAEDALAGRDPAQYFLIVVDGRRVGMIQSYLAADYPDWDEVVEAGPGVAGIDLLIGDEELIGQGLGPRVLAEFVGDVVFANPDVHAAIATVEEPNRRSWRAFEKAGFVHVRDVVEEGLPNRLMRLDRA